MSTGRKFITKTTLAREKGWRLDMVDDLIGDYDFIGKPLGQWTVGAPMYSLAVANLFDDSPEAQWRKTRKKTSRKISPKPEILEQWKAGNITDQEEATEWCIRRAWAAHTNEALDVARHLDHDHRDVFYGMSRMVLADKELRRAIRELNLNGRAWNRHILRAGRTRRLEEVQLISTRQSFKDLNDPLYIKDNLERRQIRMFKHHARKFNWNESHSQILTEMLFTLVRIRRIDLLGVLPGKFFDNEKRVLLFANFIEKSPRAEAQENTESFLKWARSMWTDEEIMATLTQVSHQLQGGGQNRNVVNFIKLFEKVAVDLPGFDDKYVEAIKKGLRKDVDERSAKFRSAVLKAQLTDIGKHAIEQTPSAPASKPKM